MTQTAPAGLNLAILVTGLAEFLREQQKLQNPILPAPFPDELARVFEMSGHHIVALVLVAQSDDEFVATERHAIVRHCAARALKAGLELSAMESDALDDYLRGFLPNLTQFISAVERLKQDTKDEIAELIAASLQVVEADGVVRMQEALYLTSLEHDLRAL
jgi:hypothetical protein